MKEDITGRRQTLPTEETKEIIGVSARMGLSGETQERIPRVVNFLYFLNAVCTHCIWSFIELNCDMISFPFTADCSYRAVWW